jgi:uncharacterized membrane protein
MRIYEKNLRSFVKTVTFRSLVVISDSVILYAVTRRVEVIVAVVVFSNVASTILYFLHERIWNKVGWGKLEINKIK